MMTGPGCPPGTAARSPGSPSGMQPDPGSPARTGAFLATDAASSATGPRPRTECPPSSLRRCYPAVNVTGDRMIIRNGDVLTPGGAAALLNYPVPLRRLRGHDRANLAGQGSLDRQPPPQPDARQCLQPRTISRRDRAPSPAAHRHAPRRAVADHRTGGPVRAQRAHAVSPVRGLHRPRAYLRQAPVEQAKRLLETASVGHGVDTAVVRLICPGLFNRATPS